MSDPVDLIDTPDTKIAQHVGFLTLRLIALEHEREKLLREVEQLQVASRDTLQARHPQEAHP